MNPATGNHTGPSQGAPWGSGAGWRYGLLGLPLAFCALPLYVLMPHFYATEWGVSLTAMGTLLLVLRLFDAALDPAMGRWCDHLGAQSVQRLLITMAAAAAVLWLAFAALFHPQVAPAQALPWAAASLGVTYLAFSLLTVAHQSWGAMLGGDAVHRSRVVAWREGLGLLGVVMASVVPAIWGVSAMTALMALGLLAGTWALAHAPRPERTWATPVASAPLSPPGTSPGGLLAPWRNPAFVRLVAVFGLNGIATAVPATLVLFFIEDRLQVAATWQGLFLGLYFVCGALSMPLWLRAVTHMGLARCWLMGMCLSVAAFAGAALVGSGDVVLYAVVCALSGLALGSDLALPAAWLAGLSAREPGTSGVYFGWWNLVTKLNLALAAGLALPLLGWLGYTPGTREADGLQALTWVYCLLPCALKLVAAMSLHGFFIHGQKKELT